MITPPPSGGRWRGSDDRSLERELKKRGNQNNSNFQNGTSLASAIARYPCCVISIVLGLCFASFVFLHFQRDFDRDIKSVALSATGDSSGFRLFAKRKQPLNLTDVVELIVDDQNLEAFRSHFRLLDRNGEAVDIDFGKRNFLQQRLATTKPISPNWSTHSRPSQFLEGLNRANLIFNGTDSRLKEALEYQYIAYEKQLPYIGNPTYTSMFQYKRSNDQIKLLNSLAVFPPADMLHYSESSNLSYAMHGLLGVNKYGERVWPAAPMPPLPGDPRVNMTDELKAGGGFYKNLSDALPLDRDVLDARDGFCMNEHFDLSSLEDASIIITFYNEHLSALLRSIHSVLNRTPPPLLREIILVDDHSNNTDLAPGGFIYDLIETLPKVKLIRMPERRGIVMARLAGAKLASAPILVILDSHIEVNPGWLEPQLQRLKESPRSLVMPQIDVIDSEHFNFTRDAGIGCWLGFKWVMQEQASLTVPINSSHPIPSPSMGGGLFAIRADWFWELGGYDEGFVMWGAENVEMGFRLWMCGGRVECTPCARVYHIYRKGGVGYSSPHESLHKNRLRTARVWMDEYSKLAELFIAAPKEIEMGNVDRMLELKDRLKCKSFQWFLDHVDPTNEVRNFTDVKSAGELRSLYFKDSCVDTLAKSDVGWKFGTYGCHGMGGTQGFMMSRSGRLILFLNDRRCLTGSGTIQDCEFVLEQHGHFTNETSPVGTKLVWHPAKGGDLTCMTAEMNSSGIIEIVFVPCEPDSGDKTRISRQRWTMESFASHLASYHPPTYSDEHKERARLAASIVEKTKDEIVWKYGKKSDGSFVDQLVLAS